MWYENESDYTATSCGCDACGGREVRLGNELTHLAAILSDPAAVHNVSVNAIRMPFVFGASHGCVLAAEVPTHA